mgnify:CR=1 FL=1
MSNPRSGHVSFVWCNFGGPFEIHGKQVTKNHETGSKLSREAPRTDGNAPPGRRPKARWGAGPRFLEYSRPSFEPVVGSREGSRRRGGRLINGGGTFIKALGVQDISVSRQSAQRRRCSVGFCPNILSETTNCAESARDGMRI